LKIGLHLTKLSSDHGVEIYMQSVSIENRSSVINGVIGNVFGFLPTELRLNAIISPPAVPRVAQQTLRFDGGCVLPHSHCLVTAPGMDVCMQVPMLHATRL